MYTHTKNSCLSDILGKATVHILTCVHILAYKKNSCLSDILGKATVHILTCVHAYKKLLFIWYIRKSNSPYPYVCTRIQKTLVYLIQQYLLFILFIWYIRKSNSPYPYVCTKKSCLSDILGKATVHILTCVHTYKKLLFIWYIRKSNSPYPYVCTNTKTLVYLIY